MEQPSAAPTSSAPSTSERTEAPPSASALVVASSVPTEEPAVSSPAYSSAAPVSLSAPATAGSPLVGSSTAPSSAGDSQTSPPLECTSSSASVNPGTSPPLSAASSAAVRLDGAIHGFDCARGELLLTEAEARAVEEHLVAEWAKKGSETGGDKSGRPLWRLQPVIEAARCPGGAKRSRKGVGASSRRGLNALSGLLDSAGVKLEPTELSASGRPQRSSRSSSSSAGPSAASAPAETLSHSASHTSSPSQEASSRRGNSKDAQAGSQSWVPSPWVCWMHEVLVELCKQPVCLPFFPRVSPRDTHYPELARKVFPAIPITLESVLDRLERNEYTCTEEVFNDVYTVFLCAFRYYEPGNQYWMMAQEASIVFQSLTQNKRLLSCDFDGFIAGALNHSSASASSLGVSTPGAAGGPGLPPASVGHQSSVGSKQQIAGRVERKGRGRDAGKAGKGKAKGRGATGLQNSGTSGELGNVYHAGASGAHLFPSGPSVPAASGVVKAEEREAFQQILGQLDMEVHLELYSVFKDRAMWLSFGTGEVELDDASTAPEVFREMVAWCRGKLAEKHQRQASHGLPHAQNLLSPAGRSAPPTYSMQAPGAAYGGAPLLGGDASHGVTHAATKRPAASSEAGNLPSPPEKKQRTSVADSGSSSSSDDGSDDDY
ncbi:conserved hypothetical protein [Neospora caninum Liverpool]|uniref:Bromo domain-containing protein n=1 Tax=Neospora caninum (strain Liverpool) TaxID=572307 RepID=F0VFX2_NEOCL|nr:conserved hypothetical protein [Neospora caninum Liverpool]CBZ52616.1 conserved hypothetical protein [Neospora caninum Liverpool]CEL66595.1 TPA: hypothetical protein BN1204_024050 [Neospora caninum Liverpool]|eukprot:XP_003882648.1 conserved hypothetical protein [Neospora caninum Liverpool]